MNSKSLSILLFCLFLCLAVFAGVSEAKITGDCDACHAKFPGMMEPKEPGKPLKYVLQGTFCVNCHTNTDRSTLKELGGMTVPAVLNQTDPLQPLAGGNFHYLGLPDGDRNGHNVEHVSGPDRKNRWAPPGYDRWTDTSVIGYNPQKPLTCAGSNGCHGDRNIEDPFLSIMGSHHADDEPVDGSTTAKSYRYLKMTDKVKGVTGGEDPRWEHDPTPSTHNEYSYTINQLCRNCHGEMHGKENTGKENPWLRHPTDVVIPNRGEYLKYNPDVQPPSDWISARVYSTAAPVARGPLPGKADKDKKDESSVPETQPEQVKRPADMVSLGQDAVMCLSCHVAHGSPYSYALRWDYDDLETGEGGSGACFICHTKKRE